MAYPSLLGHIQLDYLFLWICRSLYSFFLSLSLSFFFFVAYSKVRIPWCFRWQIIRLQCWRGRFHPWVRKVPWKSKWQPTPVFLPGEFHGQRTLLGYSPWGREESDTTEWLIHTLQGHADIFLLSASGRFIALHIIFKIIIHLELTSVVWGRGQVLLCLLSFQLPFLLHLDILLA